MDKDTKTEIQPAPAVAGQVELLVRPVPEADCGNMLESLRELAKEGAALHSHGQPERTICDGLLAALDENKRLRAALWHVQYTAKTLADAQVIALESKRPNASLSGGTPSA